MLITLMVTPVATPALIWITVAANLPLALVIVQLFIMATITVQSEQHLARLNQVAHSRKAWQRTPPKDHYPAVLNNFIVKPVEG